MSHDAATVTAAGLSETRASSRSPEDGPGDMSGKREPVSSPYRTQQIPSSRPLRATDVPFAELTASCSVCPDNTTSLARLPEYNLPKLSPGRDWQTIPEGGSETDVVFVDDVPSVDDDSEIQPSAPLGTTSDAPPLPSAAIFHESDLHSADLHDGAGEYEDPTLERLQPASSEHTLWSGPLAANGFPAGFVEARPRSTNSTHSLPSTHGPATASRHSGSSRRDTRNEREASRTLSQNRILSASISSTTSEPQITNDRLKSFERMLGRAMQYLTDSDSNADKCPDDIWLLGVRHDGWRPESHYTAASTSRTSSPSGSPTNGARSYKSRKLSRRSDGLPANGQQNNANTDSAHLSPPSSQDTLPSASPRKKAGALFKALRNGGVHPMPKTNILDTLSRSPPRLKGRDSSSSSSSMMSSPMSRQSSTASAADTASVTSAGRGASPDATLRAVDGVLATSHLDTFADTKLSHGWPPSFYWDFCSRIQLTYRSGFSGIIPSNHSPVPVKSTSSSMSTAFSSMMSGLSASLGRSAGQTTQEASSKPSGMTTDTGWGCMLRTGQSLLANALAAVHLGRNWQRGMPGSVKIEGQDSRNFGRYVRLLSLFMDDPDNSLCPFSVHQFAAEGEKLGKNVGEWFGPSTAAGAIKALTSGWSPADLGVLVAYDTTVYQDQIFSAAADPSASSPSWSRPVLILVPLRLGITGVNPIYQQSIKHFFSLPQCVGIAGGRPSSSYYFVAAQGSDLVYIDPHHTKPATRRPYLQADVRNMTGSIRLSPGGDNVENTQESPQRELLEKAYAAQYNSHDLDSYHCDKVRKMPIASLDPSMLVGLLCQSRDDWDDLCRRMKEASLGSTAIIHIAQAVPAWMRAPSRTISSADVVPAESGGRAAHSNANASHSPLDKLADDTDSDDWDIDDSDGMLEDDDDVHAPATKGALGEWDNVEPALAHDGDTSIDSSRLRTQNT
ncbi:Cysteine protease atg4 [Cystobasidiomycetes sp. EMM_F5]